MQLVAPRRTVPAVLVLGAADVPWRAVAAFCREAGVLADRARTKAGALAAFLARGGHDGVLCFGEPGPDVAAVLAALRAIDPGLPLYRLPRF